MTDVTWVVVAVACVAAIVAAIAVVQHYGRKPPPLTIAERRSIVRVRITYFAALFLFGGGAGLIGVMLALKDKDGAREIFATILPISASVIAYWFGNRGSGGIGSEIADSSQKPTDTDNDRNQPSP